MLKRGAAQAPDTSKAPVVQPPALPGAASNADTVAPATKVPSDLSPNEALFDSVNRGDIGAARDALNRGAELDARNILGMTPVELSVDLGRRDITFLLLSYRGVDSPTGPSSASAGRAAGPAPMGKEAKASRAGHAAVVPVKAVVASKTVTPPAAAEAPHLFADDGGTPVPSDGFLGFNAARPTH